MATLALVAIFGSAFAACFTLLTYWITGKTWMLGLMAINIVMGCLGVRGSQLQWCH